MASAMVELMSSSDPAVMKVDDNQHHMSVDDLCMSVQSISLTEVSVETVIKQIVKDSAEHHMLDSAADDETSRIDNQLPEHGGNIDVGQISVMAVMNQSKEAFGSCSEEVHEEAEEVDEDLRRRDEDEKDELLLKCGEKGERTGSNGQNEDGIGSNGQRVDGTGSNWQNVNGIGSTRVRQCIPQEHDEATNEITTEILDETTNATITEIHDETTNEAIAETFEVDEAGNKLVARGPTKGIPVPAYNNQAFFQAQFHSQYENALKYRKPPPDYVAPSTYHTPPGITLSSLLTGGNVSVCNKGCGFTESVGFFDNGLRPLPSEQMVRPPGIYGDGLRPLPSEPMVSSPVICGNGMRPLPSVQMVRSPVVCGDGLMHSPSEQMVTSPVIGLADNDIIDEFLQTPVNHSLMSSGGFEAIMNSANADDISENPPVTTVLPPDTFNGIPAPPGDRSAVFLTAVSPSRSADSPVLDCSSDCISPGSAWSPEVAPLPVAMSPTSTADSGLDDELDYIMSYINEDTDIIDRQRIQRAFSQLEEYGMGLLRPKSPVSGLDFTESYVGQHPIGNPSVGNPVLNPAADMAVRNPTVPVHSTVVQQVPFNTVSSVMTASGPVSHSQVPVVVPQGQVPVSASLSPVPGIMTASGPVSHSQLPVMVPQGQVPLPASLSPVSVVVPQGQVPVPASQVPVPASLSPVPVMVPQGQVPLPASLSPVPVVVPPSQVPATCFLVAAQPVQSIPTSQKTYREILPRPPDVQKAAHVSTNSGLLMFVVYTEYKIF